MDELSEMRVFVRAMELGTFSAAAKDLNMTPSAVSKLVTRLEDRLGVRLLNRTTRSLALTQEGQIYFDEGRRILSAVETLETEVTASRGRARGLVRVNSGLAFGLHQLVPRLPEFHRQYPDVRIDLALTDRLVDFHTAHVDVAIRAGNLRDSSLVARRFAEMSRVVCASPDYLARMGTPKTPADLAQHDCIVITAEPGLDRWPFRTPAGAIEMVQVAGPFASDNAEGVLYLGLAGAGIVRMGDVIVGEPIRQGQLVPILSEFHDDQMMPVSAVLAPGTQRIPRIRAFVDFLVDTYGDSPWRCSNAVPEGSRLPVTTSEAS